MRTFTDYPLAGSLAEHPPKGITIGLNVRCFLAAMFLILPVRLVPAQTTWTGGGANNNWSTSQNWTPLVAPANDGTANLIMAGVTHGPSDDFGYKPADREHPTEVYDIHATMLYLRGIDHTRLTVRHDGIDRRLTDVHGHVIKEVFA